MAKWAKAIEAINGHLAANPLRNNYCAMELAAREAVRKAADSGDETALRQAMGEASGLRRRWRQALVLHLTQCVFLNASTSRFKIRDWQRRTFGQSLSSGLLKAYAKTDRSGGGRSGFAEPSAEDAAKAKELFGKYKDALRRL